MDKDEIKCTKCNNIFRLDDKKYIFTPLGYVDPKTKQFISTSQWCLKCCINLEKMITS